MQHSGYSGEFVARLCHEVFSSHDTQDLDGAASAAAMLSCFVHPGGRRSFSAEDVVKLLAAFWPMPIAHAAVTAVSEFAEESRS